MVLLESLWFIAPAYAANAFPVISKGKYPLDFGKKINGKRILGDGKTIEGTFLGILFGVLIGAMQISIQPYIPVELKLNLAIMTMPLAVMLSIGTLLGDLGGSFIKRRVGMKRGDHAFLLDQLGFLAVALLLASFVFTVDIVIVITLVIITPIFHLFFNAVGYFVRMKRNPW